MADIFGNVQPPAWLQRLTEPSEPGMLGKIFGELVGGLADSSETAINTATDKQSKGINTNWIKELPGSIKGGLAEARLNVQNPQWRLQAQQAQLNMVAQKQRMDAEQYSLTAQKNAIAQWEQDAPKLSEWMSLPYDQLLKTPIDVKSQQALTLVERQKAAAAKLAMDSTANKVRTTFAEALLGVDDPQVLSEIQAMPAGQNGQPSPQQIARLNKYRESKGDPRLGEKPAPKAPASVELVNEIQKSQDEMDAAQTAGDDDAYNRAKERHDLLLEQTKGQEIVTETDPTTGAVRTIIGKGVSGKSKEGPTVAARTKAQETLVKYENATNAIESIKSQLTPEMVGVQGFLGDVVVDRGLAQFVPGAAVGQRIKGRTALRMLREGMMRQVSEDQRFSQADRAEIQSIFPSLGPGESYPDAVAKLDQVEGVIASRSIVHAKSIGREAPPWALKQTSKEQIKQLFDDGTLTQQEALDALMKYH